MKFKTKIISAFPGMGKTHYHNLHPDTTLDSDSSKFSWLPGAMSIQRNLDFPNNYIKHIKENIGKYEYIFVSSHKVVRDALVDNCLHFYLVYPHFDRKEEFLNSYKARGNNDAFVELLDKNWGDWIKECSDESCCGSRYAEIYSYSHLDHVINTIEGHCAI